MGSHSEAAAEELAPSIREQTGKPGIFTALELGRDEFVNGVRWSCATEQIAGSLRENGQLAIENGREPDDVTPAEVCPKALQEAGRRDILEGMYRTFRNFDPETGENDPRGAWLQILSAADQNQSGTGLPILDDRNEPTGRTHALTCALAMDAGYKFGRENPDFDPEPDLTLEDVAPAIGECLADGSRMATTDGLLIGLKLAERDREIDLAAADRVPDARPEQTVTQQR